MVDSTKKKVMTKKKLAWSDKAYSPSNNEQRSSSSTFGLVDICHYREHVDD